MSKKIILFTLMAVLFAGLSYAQMGQVGSIRGTVTIENEGAPLPGVNITLRSPAMILPSMSAMTNDKGNYRFLNLSPGVYELTFEISGFGTIIRKDIVVSANMTFSVDIAMSPERVEEAITVMGQAPTIDRQSTAKTTTLDKTFLASVPAGRDLNYFLNMTPGVTGNSAQGATVRDNMYAVDGVQINDPSVGTITGNPLSIEIMEEISVQAGGASAEWGAVRGSLINVVTKSGGNKLSGDVQFLYQGEDWRSNNTKGTPFTSMPVGNKFWIEPSFSIGGPLIKDKLWFFSNFTYRGLERYAAGFPYDGTPVPLKDKSTNPYFKFTFQPGTADKFVAAISYQKQNQTPQWGDQWSNMDSVQDDPRTIIVPSLHWIHTWNSKFITSIKVGGLFYKWDWVPTTEQGRNPGYQDASTYLWSNGTGFEDLYQRNRYQLNADGTLFLDDLAGSHEIKFGVQSSINATRRLVHVWGPKDAGGLSQLYLYFWEGTPYYASWAAGFSQKARALNVGLFLNDAWNVTKKLTLNLGARFDYNVNFTPVQQGTVDPDVPAAGSLAYLGYPELTWDMDIEKKVTNFKWNTFSPRLGLVYDLMGDGKTLLKANFSQYTMDNYTAITWFVSQVGWIWVDGYTNPDGSLDVTDGEWVPGSNVTIGYPGKPLKAPRTYEADLALERELVEDISVGLRYIRRWERQLIEDVDASALDMDALMNRGELIWDATRWTPVQVVDPYDNKTVTFYRDDDHRAADVYMVNVPGLKRDYNAFEFTLRKRFSRGWSFDLSYVYSKATGLVQNTYWESELDEPLYNNPNAHTNAYGRMSLDRPHQLKFSAVVKGPWGINISTYTRYLSGYASRRRFSSTSAGVSYVNWTINSEPYGSYRFPSQLLIDFRLEKEFRIGSNLSLRVFGDVFNVTNTNKTTDWQTTSNNAYTPFQKIYSILDSRSYRVGAKIAF